VSTYGQLAVLAVNVVVFVVAIMLVEPWKRRRLTQAFERKVQEMEMANLDVVNKGMGALQSRLEKQEEIILAQLAGISSSTAPPPPARVLQEQQKRAAAVEFAGIALARSDVRLIAASVSAGILAWALRGWVGL
jgi:sensitive to high expression protein 9